MFAYRHAFHAGNHADVIKHAVALHVLQYLQKKDGPLMVIDTHAGAGRYRTDAKLVRDKAEFQTGLGRLWPMRPENLPPMIQHYMSVVRAASGSADTLSSLPGSPLLLANCLRPDDQLRAFEMHPTDFPLLAETLSGRGRRVKADKSDGFHALRALLPPASRRGLVLIDPPYELKEDYTLTLNAVKDGLARWANGCYIIWVPMIQRFEVQRFLRAMAQLEMPSHVLVNFQVRAPLEDGLGLLGSHLIVINPPYGLVGALKTTLPWLVKQLGQDPSASFQITSLPKPDLRRASPIDGREVLPTRRQAVVNKKSFLKPAGKAKPGARSPGTGRADAAVRPARPSSRKP